MSEYTKSPLNDPRVREATLKAVKAEYGENLADDLFVGGTNTQDKEENLNFDIDIVSYKTDLNFDELIKNFQCTEHLLNFDIFDRYLGLDGQSYLSYKKALWYYVHSLVQPTKSYKINYKTTVDNRFSLLGIAPPASGKTTTKNRMKKIIPIDNTIEVTGLCHPQQLIGKTIPATSKKPKKEIPGFLSYIQMIHDECQDMLNEKNDLYATSQKIKRQAMDNYGDNIIDKKQVDNTDKHQTISPTRFLDFAHPKKLESPFFDTGSFRRYPGIFNLICDDYIDLNKVTEFRLDNNNSYNNYPYFLSKEIKRLKFDTFFDQQTLDIISCVHKIILRFLLNHKNENAFRYAMLMRYDFRAKLSKIIYLLAMAKGETTPSIDTVIKGCGDYLLFVFESIKAINTLANIGTTSDVWHGLSEEDSVACTWLLRKKALSYETSDVSIAKFWTVLSHVHGCKNTQARSYFYKLKENGFVNSKKGKNTSRIWLTFIPQDLKIIDNNYSELKYLEILAKTASIEKPVLTVLKEEISKNYKGNVEELIEKMKSDGSVGVLGYSYIYTRSSSYILYYINNIIKVPPENDTSDTLDKNTTIIEENKPPKTVKTPKNTPTLLENTKTEKEDIISEEQSTRDVQYFEAEECKSIKMCDKKEVLKYIKDNPKKTLKELISKFGPGILSLKKKGVIK